MADTSPRNDTINALLEILSPTSWQYNCLSRLLKLDDEQWSTVHLVNETGYDMTNFSSNTWGIRYGSCMNFCGPGAFQYPFDYATFSNAMTNYLLPWLGLCAQLPYETGQPFEDMMSFCLAVGSPALITYSLTLTIQNRSWARKRFAKLKKKASGDAKAQEYAKRIDAASFLLQEGQQVPLRASQEHGWLASLIVLPSNQEWWSRLRDRLYSTKRGFSYSLFAQMGLAMTAWIFTVIAAFVVSLGDPDTALQIASGAIWIWLVPIVLGWVMVGVQIKHNSIENALHRDDAWCARDPPMDRAATSPTTMRTTLQQETDVFADLKKQQGLTCFGGLSPQPHKTLTAGGAQTWAERKYIEEIPGWAGFSIAGDEETKGPAYNYARLFTWWKLSNTLEKAMEKTLENIRARKLPQPSRSNDRPPPWDDIERERIFNVDNKKLAKYCDLDKAQHFEQYPTWTELPPDVLRRMVVASFAAIFVQWGTASDPIMTAYLTPTIGLGCRSGSYLIYATTGTVAWLLLTASMLLSNEAMLIYQTEHATNPGKILRRPSFPSRAQMLRTSQPLLHPQTPDEQTPEASEEDADNANDLGRTKERETYTRSLSHTLICALAVILRLIGKLFCIANALWLITSTLLEFIGAFDNCWCMSIYAMQKDSGWIVLFKTARDLSIAAALPWGGGLAFIIVVVIAATVFFGLGTLDIEL